MGDFELSPEMQEASEIHRKVSWFIDDIEEQTVDAFCCYKRITDDDILKLQSTYEGLKEEYGQLKRAVETLDGTEGERGQLEEASRNLVLFENRMKFFAEHVGGVSKKTFAMMLAETRKQAFPGAVKTMEWLDLVEETVTTFRYKDRCFVDVVQSKRPTEETIEYAYLTGLTLDELDLLVEEQDYYDAFLYVDLPKHNRAIKKVWLCGGVDEGDYRELDFVDQKIVPLLKEKLPEILETEFGIKV